MAKRKRKTKVETKHEVESEYYEDIEITDPITGEVKTIKQKITRYKAKAGALASDDDEEEVDVIESLKHGLGFEPILDIDA